MSPLVTEDVVALYDVRGIRNVASASRPKCLLVADLSRSRAYLGSLWSCERFDDLKRSYAATEIGCRVAKLNQ